MYKGYIFNFVDDFLIFIYSSIFANTYFDFKFVGIHFIKEISNVPKQMDIIMGNVFEIFGF